MTISRSNPPPTLSCIVLLGILGVISVALAGVDWGIHYWPQISHLFHRVGASGLAQAALFGAMVGGGKPEIFPRIISGLAKNNSEEVLESGLNFAYCSSRQTTQFFADKRFINSDYFTCFDNRWFRKMGESHFFLTQEIVFFSNGLRDLGGNSHNNHIAVGIVEGTRRYNHSWPLFKRREISEGKGNEDYVAFG